MSGGVTDGEEEEEEARLVGEMEDGMGRGEDTRVQPQVKQGGEEKGDGGDDKGDGDVRAVTENKPAAGSWK